MKVDINNTVEEVQGLGETNRLSVKVEGPKGIGPNVEVMIPTEIPDPRMLTDTLRHLADGLDSGMPSA